MLKIKYNKVFGIGLNKTGTNSLTAALNHLGITSIHYPHDQQTYKELSSGNVNLSVLDVYQSITDVTAVPYWSQFNLCYPNSLFILTVRDIEQWLKSVENHYRINEKIYDPTVPSNNPAAKEFAMFINIAVFGCLKFNRERYKMVYENHFKSVTTFLGKEKLLVLDICGGDGWTPLCDFLGLPCPTIAFPHENKGDYPRQSIG